MLPKLTDEAEETRAALTRPRYWERLAFRSKMHRMASFQYRPRVGATFSACNPRRQPVRTLWATALRLKIAAILSVVESCRRLKLSVRDYLAAVLHGFADLPIQRLPDLTPAAWAPSIYRLKRWVVSVKAIFLPRDKSHIVPCLPNTPATITQTRDRSVLQSFLSESRRSCYASPYQRGRIGPCPGPRRIGET